MKDKLSILFFCVLGALVVLLGRISFINFHSGEKYKKQVLSQAQQKYENRTMPAKRGSIYDRNGNVLATSNKVYNVILDCKAVNTNSDYMEPTVNALVTVLGLDEGDIRTRLTAEETKESQYQILKKQISMDDKKAFEEYCSIPEDTDMTKEEIQEKNNIQGVWFEEDYLRVYPYNELACDTLGFTFSRDTADYGLEGYYNSSLTGIDGRQYGYFSSDSNVEQTIIEATDGNSLETSLDLGIQQIVEKWVTAFKESTGSKNIGVIVENPSNGEILAMDGGDRYDLNNPRDLSSLYSQDEIKAMNDEETMDALSAMWNNFCVTDIYEPGSVVKPIVMAAALEQGKISTTDTFYCDGYQNFGVPGNITTIKCANIYGHGMETLAEVIANSCIPLTQYALTGTPFDLRGYYMGQYRDKSSHVVMAEYRQMLNTDRSTWLKRMLNHIGFVAWTGCGFMGPTPGKIEGVLPNYGVGLRIEVQPRMNVRLDLGKNTVNNQMLFYFNMTEAF